LTSEMNRDRTIFAVSAVYCLAVAEGCCWLATAMVLESLRSYRIHAGIDIYPGISALFLQIGWWFCAVPAPWLFGGVWAVTRKELPPRTAAYFTGTLSVTLVLFTIVAAVSGLSPWMPIYCPCHHP